MYMEQTEEQILDELKSLSLNELKNIFAYVKEKLSEHTENLETKTSDLKESKHIKIICPHCKSRNIKKNGPRILTSGARSQRYQCKDCKKTFNNRTHTIFSSAKISLSQIEKFIECYINYLSLERCGEICEFSKQTAFLWRHKLCNALKPRESKVVLKGIAEADETYFPVSYKGNHSKDGFTMPRVPRHNVNGERYQRLVKEANEKKKRGISTDKVCVCCAIEPNGLPVARITNLGNPTIEQIHEGLDGFIKANSVMVTDKKSAYRKFAKANDINLIQVKIKRNELDEALLCQPYKKNQYHVNHINSFHSILKTTIARFKGISSKYLDNYITMCMLSKFSGSNKFGVIVKDVTKEIFTADCVCLRKNISKRPPIPFCQSTVDTAKLAEQALGIA